MKNIEIQEISAAQTYQMRHSVLRQNQPLSECHYPHDVDESTHHFGAFENNELIAICSVYQQGHELIANNDNCWRIRGMATLEAYRKQGIASQLLQYSIGSINNISSDSVFWCNARISATSFYERHGFHKTGEQFEIEGIGPHFIMVNK